MYIRNLAAIYKKDLKLKDLVYRIKVIIAARGYAERYFKLSLKSRKIFSTQQTFEIEN